MVLISASLAKAGRADDGQGRDGALCRPGAPARRGGHARAARAGGKSPGGEALGRRDRVRARQGAQGRV